MSVCKSEMKKGTRGLCACNIAHTTLHGERREERERKRESRHTSGERERERERERESKGPAPHSGSDPHTTAADPSLVSLSPPSLSLPLSSNSSLSSSLFLSLSLSLSLSRTPIKSFPAPGSFYRLNFSSLFVHRLTVRVLLTLSVAGSVSDTFRNTGMRHHIN